MRFHKIANVNKALDYIASKGVKLVSIGAEGKFSFLWCVSRKYLIMHNMIVGFSFYISLKIYFARNKVNNLIR